MGTGFARHSAARRNNDRDRLIFIAAAGLAFALMIIMLVVLNFQSTVSAKEQISQSSTAVTSSPVVPQVGTITLLVPDRPVSAGQRLADVPMKEIIWPRNQVPDGAIRDRSEFASLYAKRDLPQGLPLQIEHLTSQPMQASLPVTPGNRAVTIEVDATSGLEGLALPGTHVDVVLTYTEQGELTSKIIVQNARILSSGGDTATVSERSQLDRSGPSAAKTVTLDVSTRDALRINTARQLGRLNLAMRSSDDSKVAQEVEVTANQVAGDSEKKARTDRALSSTCTKGHYRIAGQNFQLNCDGSRFQIEDAGE